MRPVQLVNALRSTLRVLLFALAVLSALAVTVLAAAVVLAWACDQAVADPDTLSRATICALIGWLFVAVFHVKHETFTVSFGNRHAFLGRLRAQLKDLGYDARRMQGERQLFRPAFHALLFGGIIRVRVEGRFAHLAGPKLSLERLRKRLRVQNHLENDLKAFWDARRRRNERRLKRVQISLRLSNSQGQGACRDLVEALAREGADVLCDVNLLAQCEEGIRESTVDGLIREWLSRPDVRAVVHKEHVPAGPNARLGEPVPAANAAG
jgi:hypothetical protein